MAIQMLGAAILTFLAVALFGKRFVPWLEKKGFAQPIKKEVDDRIYSETSNDSQSETGDLK